jgi:hypothetical protein
MKISISKNISLFNFEYNSFLKLGLILFQNQDKILTAWVGQDISIISSAVKIDMYSISSKEDLK